MFRLYGMLGQLSNGTNDLQRKFICSFCCALKPCVIFVVSTLYVEKLESITGLF